MTLNGFFWLSAVQSSSGRIVSSLSVDAASYSDAISVAAQSCSSTTSGVTGGTPMSSSSGNCNKCMLYAAGLVAGGVLIGYLVGSALTAKRLSRLNHKISLNSEKVADSCDIEDIGEKKSFCRCWKSEKFPYCDGSHNKHNKETGDNVGPVTIKGKVQ